jgi:hypothetical protein
MTVLAGSDGFWKYDVEEPGEPEDDIPIGAGRRYLESEENSLRLHIAMGDAAAIEEGCRMVRKLRDSTRIETSMMQTLKATLGQHCRYRFIVVAL